MPSTRSGIHAEVTKATKTVKRPPGPPWIKLERDTPTWGYASVYLSDDLARWPVRDVTRPGDNKSDPNLETLTYGLCSTCEPNMRISIVNRGIPYMFFMTNHRSAGRALTGFYEIGWYAKGPLSDDRGDYALAASRGKFFDPLPVADLPNAAATVLGTRFRQFKRVPPDETDALRGVVDAAEDRTADYISEIHRLERFSSRHTGYTYPTWRRGGSWDWPAALKYLTPTSKPALKLGQNTSATGVWECTECGSTTTNTARLKACPSCGRLATLVPGS